MWYTIIQKYSIFVYHYWAHWKDWSKITWFGRLANAQLSTQMAQPEARVVHLPFSDSHCHLGSGEQKCPLTIATKDDLKSANGSQASVAILYVYSYISTRRVPERVVKPAE